MILVRIENKKLLKSPLYRETYLQSCEVPLCCTGLLRHFTLSQDIKSNNDFGWATQIVPLGDQFPNPYNEEFAAS